MSGVNYSVTDGFWSLIQVVQTAGGPNLHVVPNRPNSVKILWADTGSYTLLQNSTPTGAGWTPTGYTVTHASGTNSITITPPVGSLFSG
jgi:hypothetical protein